jgi:UDP-N-acetylenolpyruvoylglucosamine reductase
VRVGAGLRLKNLCGLATKAGLVGFEFLEGIPGNVGGALRMNAGAMGGWMFDVVVEVNLVNFAGEMRTLRKEEMHVDYRHCAELHEAIAVGAVLRPAAQAEAESISRQIDTYRDKRQKSQPREPSAGCIFKNPPGDSAGRLIDQAGLKGERVGDAEVSPVHANFIVNRGHATSADVIALVRKVRTRVEAAHGVKLEREVLLYGKRWEDVL